MHISKHIKREPPLRPVINSIQAPSYKLAKYLNKKLQGKRNLPNNYNTRNSKEVALELLNTQIKDYHRNVSLDIKDLYVNIPIEDILQITKSWLKKQKHNNKIIEQTIRIREIILKQNYFQYDNRFYQPKKGIAMGSSISSTIAVIYLQHLEDRYVKHTIENREIIYYKRYVDDLLVIFDQTKTSVEAIQKTANNLDHNLQFKIATEENNMLSYLDLDIHRKNSKIEINIHRKSTHINIVINFN
jgi:hypothetical protein